MDTNGCSASAGPLSVTVTANPVATINPAGTVNICIGDTIPLSTVSGISYLWSTGDTTSSIDVSVAGTFTVFVTYSGGCSDTSDITTVVEMYSVTETALNCSLQVAAVICGVRVQQLRA